MTAHVYHEEIGPILKDKCPRCLEHAQTLTEMDPERVARLIDEWRADQEGQIDRRLTETERHAIERIRMWGRVVFASGITEEECR